MGVHFGLSSTRITGTYVVKKGCALPKFRQGSLLDWTSWFHVTCFSYFKGWLWKIPPPSYHNNLKYA